MLLLQRGRSPAFYKKNKNSEDLDRSLLIVVPDAPRIAEQGFPPSFDWKFLPAKFYNTSLKPANSEINLSSNLNGNSMKTSNSAFEILSRSNSNLVEGEGEAEEIVEKKEIKAVERPRTFKWV